MAPANALPTNWMHPLSPRPRQLWQVPALFTGLLAILLVASAPTLRQPDPAVKFERDLDTLRRRMTERNVAIEELLALAEQVAGHSEQYPAKAGLAQLLGGTVYLRKAERGSMERSAEWRQKALYHLALAEKLGVPVADQPQLWYRLGKLFFLTDGEPKRTIDYLMRSAGVEEPVECYGMLVKTHLRLPTPDVDAALAANLKQIEHADDEVILGPARLIRGQLLLKKNQRAEALKVLERIGPTAPAPLRMQARTLQARCCMDAGLWSKAIPLWQELLGDPSAVPGGKGRVLYLLGLCYHKLDPKSVDAVNTWHAAAKGEGEEAQAAALKLAELQLQSANPIAALDYFQQALGKVASAKDYTNTLVDANRVLELLESGLRVYGERQDHERVQRLAELYKRLSAEGSTNARLAQAIEAQAKALRAKARQAIGDEIEKLEQQARAQYLSAAGAYVQSAETAKSVEQLDCLWRGIQCYLQVPDHAKAIVVLQRFVTLSPPAEQQSEAWFVLASAYQALKQTSEAEQAYQRCMQTPGGTFVTKARYELALLKIDTKDFAVAEKILEQNLQETASSPDRAAHERSLFKLAELLVQQRKFHDASVRFKQALQLYPSHAGILQARNQLGTCYRRLAEQLEKDLVKNAKEMPERQWAAGTRASKVTERHGWIDQAQSTYQELADDLELRAKTAPLSPRNQELLRQATMLSADCLLELPDSVAQCMPKYKTIAQRYRQHLEGLVATARLCECWRLAQSDPKLAVEALEEARAAVAAALEHLKEMPDTVFEGPPGTWEMSRWDEWLKDANTRLRRAIRTQ
jgi:tetratricopeptide (TPR) repeat protein